jgi:hypothetical protein
MKSISAVEKRSTLGVRFMSRDIKVSPTFVISSGSAYVDEFFVWGL